MNPISILSKIKKENPYISSINKLNQTAFLPNQRILISLSNNKKLIEEKKNSKIQVLNIVKKVLL